MPCPPPGDLPNPGIEPASLMSPALTGRFLNTSVPSLVHKMIPQTDLIVAHPLPLASVHLLFLAFLFSIYSATVVLHLPGAKVRQVL